VTGPLDCPSCGRAVRATVQACDCGWTPTRRDGILSFGTASVAGSPYDDLGEKCRRSSLRDALDALNLESDRYGELVDELFAYGRECWRHPVAPRLKGRCLDLYAGTGRRAGLLSQQVDELVAVEPSLAKLAILDRRTDLSSDACLPVHGSVSDVPFGDRTFETVIVDERRIRQADETLDEVFALVDQLLTPKGSVIVLTGGPSNDWLSAPSSVRRLRRVVRGHTDSVGQLGSLVDATVHGLYPSASNPDFVVDVTDSAALERFRSVELTANGTAEAVAKRALGVLQSVGLLRYLLPGYVVTLARSPIEQSNIDSGVILRGRYRSTTLAMDDRELNTITKVPNAKRYSRFNERERTTLDAIESNLESTLPRGKTTETVFGETRVERAVD